MNVNVGYSLVTSIILLFIVGIVTSQTSLLWAAGCVAVAVIIVNVVSRFKGSVSRSKKHDK